MSDTTGAYLFKPGESELRWMGATSTHFLATGALTGGAFALVEERTSRGISVPLHRHDDDMESFYVLEGEMSFYLGGHAGVRVPAGTFTHIPGGTVHGFRIDSEMARYLILTTSRHAQFYHAITSLSPEAAITDAMIQKACREFGIEFVGALPD